MNCLEFRKALLTEPGRGSEALRAHAAGCAACAQFAQASLRFERLLAEAIDLPVPDGLQEGILRQQRAEEEAGRAPVDRRRFLAMAACVGAAAAGTLGFLGWRQRDAMIDALVFHALEVHAPGLVTTASNPAAARLAVHSLMVSTGITPGPMDGLVVEDAWPCATLGIRGTHLRLSAPSGIVDVSHSPGEMIGRARVVERGGLIVEMHPHPSGMLTLVSSTAPALDEVRPATFLAFGLSRDA